MPRVSCSSAKDRVALRREIAGDPYFPSADGGRQTPGPSATRGGVLIRKIGYSGSAGNLCH
jgi:hypothetical protein